LEWSGKGNERTDGSGEEYRRKRGGIEVKMKGREGKTRRKERL
jgi:hypothetical protein